MSTLADRKHLELQRKLTGLSAEFAAWQMATNDGQPLRLHQSQVGAILGLKGVAEKANKAPLAVLWRNLQKRLPADPPGPAKAEAFLDEAAELEYLLLGAHTLWDFFREKLAQRFIPDSREFLAMADELAWACYKPARDAAGGKQAPPLVYLAAIETLAPGDRLDGPALRARGKEWLPAETPAVFTAATRLRSVIEPLAIPVMNLTRAQASHLPDLPIVAHEAGHAVEDDFKLTKELEEAVRVALTKAKKEGVNPGPKKAWMTWLGEIFADLHGVVHLGPGFLPALMDLLAGDRMRRSAEDGRLDFYPTDSLRLRINRAAMVALGFSTEAEVLGKAWLTAVPQEPLSPVFDPGVPFIVDGLLTTKLKGLGGKCLADLGGWTKKRRDALTDLAGTDVHMTVTNNDTRLVTAAMRLAYDRDPAGFFVKEKSLPHSPCERWQDGLRRCQPPTGTRGESDVAPPNVDLESLLLAARPGSKPPANSPSPPTLPIP